MKESFRRKLVESVKKLIEQVERMEGECLMKRADVLRMKEKRKTVANEIGKLHEERFGRIGGGERMRMMDGGCGDGWWRGQ